MEKCRVVRVDMEHAPEGRLADRNVAKHLYPPFGFLSDNAYEGVYFLLTVEPPCWHP